MLISQWLFVLSGLAPLSVPPTAIAAVQPAPIAQTPPAYKVQGPQEALLKMRVLMANGEPSQHPGAILLDANGRVLPVKNGLMDPYGLGPINIAAGLDGTIETKVTALVRYVAVRDVLHRPVIVPVPETGEVLNVQLTEPVAIARLHVAPHSRINTPIGWPEWLPPGIHPSSIALIEQWNGLLPRDELDRTGPSHALTLGMGYTIARTDDEVLFELPLASIEPNTKYVVEAEWLDGELITAIFPEDSILVAATYALEQSSLSLAPDPKALIDLAPFRSGAALAGQDLWLSDWGSLLIDDRLLKLDAIDIHRCQGVVTMGPKQAAYHMDGRLEGRDATPDLPATTTCLGVASSLQADDLHFKESKTQAFHVLDSRGHRVRAGAYVTVGHALSGGPQTFHGFPLSSIGEGNYAFESACGADHVVQVRMSTSLERFDLPAGTTDAIFQMPATGKLRYTQGPISQILGWGVLLQSAETGRLIDLTTYQTFSLPVGQYVLTPQSFNHFPIPTPMWEPRTIEIKADETTVVEW